MNERHPIEDIELPPPTERPLSARRGDSRTVNWLAVMVVIYGSKKFLDIEVTEDQITDFLGILPPIDEIVDFVIVAGGSIGGIYYRIKARSRLGL